MFGGREEAPLEVWNDEFGPWLAVGLWIVVLAGCGGEEVFVIDAPGGSGAVGEDGPYGVGWVQRRFRVRVDESIEADVFVPMESSTRVADGPFPTVVGIQGGRVPSEAYRWMYRHVASRGFVVIAPRHAAQLAIFETGNAPETLAAVRRHSERTSGPLEAMVDDRRALVMGHSLGGVVAAKNWLYQPEMFSHLAMFASYAAESEDFERSVSGKEDRILSVIGGRDERSDNAVRKARTGVERFEAPATFGIVEGMNHYQWGDLPTTGQLSKDAPSTVDTEVARRRFLPLLDAFLRGFTGKDESLLGRPDDWPEGVVTWEAWQGRGEGE